MISRRLTWRFNSRRMKITIAELGYARAMPRKNPKERVVERPPAKGRRPYKPRDPAITSAIMSAVRGRNNKADLALRRELWKRGRRYRLYVKSLYGTPDLVFRSQRVAVFVDGDYWHGRTLIERGREALASVFHESKQAFWVAKITRNVNRDAENTRLLREGGWHVIRLWESDVLRDIPRAADVIERALDSARA